MLRPDFVEEGDAREDAERMGFTYSWIYHGEVKRLTSFHSHSSFPSLITVENR